jgi:hypothetical protein
MLLTITLALLFLAPQEKPRPHIPANQLNDIATILAHDYTLDPMKPDVDDGFDSIGVYKKAHLVRMYSINRTTGQIVDFMRGCQVFRFKDLENFEQRIRTQSHAPALTDAQLAVKAGCPNLAVISTRRVH